jgi:hypothetical protein
MADEIFPASRDQYRWLAVSHSDGRRCQLQTPPTTAHTRVQGVIRPFGALRYTQMDPGTRLG